MQSVLTVDSTGKGHVYVFQMLSAPQKAVKPTTERTSSRQKKCDCLQEEKREGAQCDTDMKNVHVFMAPTLFRQFLPFTSALHQLSYALPVQRCGTLKGESIPAHVQSPASSTLAARKVRLRAARAPARMDAATCDWGTLYPQKADGRPQTCRHPVHAVNMVLHQLRRQPQQQRPQQGTCT